MKVSVDYINRLAILDNNSLYELKRFIDNYSSWSRILNKNDAFFNNSWYAFEATVHIELSDGEYYFSKPVSEVLKCIREYKKILSKVDDLGILKSVYQTFNDDNARNAMFSIINALIVDRNCVKNNMEKFMDLGITDFEFNPYRNLDKSYKSYIDVSSEDRTLYAVNGVYSDGIRTLRKDCGNICYLGVKDAKYVIEYYKIKDGRYKINVNVRNLRFNAKSLPTKEKLCDINVIPDYFNYDEVLKEFDSKKCKELTIGIIGKCDNLKKALSDYLNNCPKGELSADNIADINDISNYLSHFIDAIKPIDDKDRRGKSRTLERKNKNRK